MKLSVKHLQLFEVQTQLKSVSNESPKYMPSYAKICFNWKANEKIVSMEKREILEKFFFCKSEIKKRKVFLIIISI